MLDVVELFKRYGNSPRICASEQGRASVVKLLLSKGANPNDKNIRGDTALTFATAKGHKYIVKLLTFWPHCVGIIVFRELGRDSALLYSLFDYHFMSILSYI